MDCVRRCILAYLLWDMPLWAIIWEQSRCLLTIGHLLYLQRLRFCRLALLPCLIGLLGGLPRSCLVETLRLPGLW